MTSPSTQFVEEFTGSNGSAWPQLTSAVNQTGTFSSTSDTIQTNKGRAAATTSAASTLRRHQSSGFQLAVKATPYEVRATLVRNTLSVKPGILMFPSSTSGTANYLFAQVDTFTGKSTTYGLAIKKSFSGTVTALANNTSVTNAGVTATVLGIAFRYWPLGNGNAVLQAKLWDTGGSEPAWVWPTSAVAGSVTTGTGAIGYVLSSTDIASLPSSGFYGMLEEGTASALSYTVDWDTFNGISYDGSAIINTNFGGLTATATAGVERYWNTVTEKSNMFGNGAQTGTGGVASWWTTSGTAWSMSPSTDYLTSTDGTSSMSYDTTDTVHSLALPNLFACKTVAGGAVAGTTPRYIIRYKDTDNYVFFAFDATSNKYRFMKRVAGVETVVDSDLFGQGAFGFSYFLKLSASGTTFRVVHKNFADELAARTYTISDADLQTGTQVKISAGGDSSQLMRAVRVGIGSSINRTDFGGLTATATASVTSASTRLTTVGGTLTFVGGSISVI